MKEELCDADPILLANPEQPSAVETDARKITVGAVLLQNQGEDQYRMLFSCPGLNAAK